VTVRYQADADLKRVILLAVARQEPAVDFRSAAEAGLVALPDKQVLAAPGVALPDLNSLPWLRICEARNAAVLPWPSAWERESERFWRSLSRAWTLWSSWMMPLPDASQYDGGFV
jgi:hypothetical protein